MNILFHFQFTNPERDTRCDVALTVVITRDGGGRQELIPGEIHANQMYYPELIFLYSLSDECLPVVHVQRHVSTRVSQCLTV